MGRTNPTMRERLQTMRDSEWENFQRTLRKQNQEAYTDLWGFAMRHADAVGAANPRRPMEGVLLSIALEQQLTIHELKEKIEDLQDEIGVIAGRVESLEHESSPVHAGEQVAFSGDAE